MLRIQVAKTELFDEKTSTFRVVEAQTLVLEHSLISISKWESKWHKPFLGQEPKTPEEDLDYIRCMSVKDEPTRDTLLCLTNAQRMEIANYINDPMTATTIKDRKAGRSKGRRAIITNEQVYCWMVQQQIPFSCEKWHFNRLLTLIKVCGIENMPKEKMSRQDNVAQRKALNAARRAKHGTPG